MGERTDRVVMRYEVEGAQDVVTAEADGIAEGLWSVDWLRRVVNRNDSSSEREGDWAAFGPQTSGN